MKTRFLTATKEILADRRIFLFALAIITIVIVYILYVAFSLHPSDVQIATHYSAFGETHYYRNKWHYMLSFIGFAVMIGVVHLAILLRFVREGFRPLAIAFAWFSLGLLLMAFIFTHSVLKIAFLA